MSATLPVELDDIQGLVRFGYKHHTEAAFLLLRVRDGGSDAARRWLATVAVSTAATVEPLPETALQVAFSSDGMRALGVADAIIEGFASEFVAGMGRDANRARRLGDIGANDPARWQWGAGPRVPHVLLLLYAMPGRLAAWQAAIEAQCATGFELLTCLATSDLDGIEPFGFTDGISQPLLDWERRRPARDAEQAAYTNLSCLGEYLLGYPNEYGGYTDRPLLDPASSTMPLPRAEDEPTRADLGRNGSYLVLRQLRQDVHGLWKFVDRQADGDATRRERIASAMVGRGRDGTPLVGQTGETIEGGGAADDLNAFTYRSDPHGLRCPLGAHVRRSNPRNADLPVGPPGLISWAKRTLGFDAEALDMDLVASTRFHRLLRRGREYGAGVSVSQAIAEPGGGAEPGLHFICLGANLARQFEFVQNAWAMALHFDGLPGESDPLLGSRLVAADGVRSDGFSIQRADGPAERIVGLPQFVTVLGGAYFFLPGIRALRYLATTR
jgi:deferrochelatase/peroxidase EfeB